MGAYTDAEAAVRSMWSANWAGSEQVIWRENGVEETPNVGEGDLWLDMEVAFLRETVVAYGGGTRANERELSGRVIIGAMAPRGSGQTALFTLLDSAVDAFRSRRSGGLSMIGEAIHPEAGPSEDGSWFRRAAVVVFTYRFQG